MSFPPRRNTTATQADLLSGEGDQEESWPVEEAHSEDDQAAQSTDFAPRGASRFQDRVRNKLPKPLDLKNTRQGVVVEKLYGACSVRSPHCYRLVLRLDNILTALLASPHSMLASAEVTMRDSWNSSDTLLSLLSF